ncbi:hypothetical protein B0A48_12142 [Cryoendolithus antarcticus]|uniref:Methyltransferase domain-containing protein n=1 Tax=Cryoendolithus antarcticus TaxID=1507870 RepID=A0A1V8SU92_9PEZI|nr:hypothetical protein B0A48_12142 [Cryoendolithus antarcticus]
MFTTAQPRNEIIIGRHGREYSAFGIRQGINFLPVDSDEQDRLTDFEDLVYQLRGDGYLPRLLQDSEEDEISGEAVLDCGFGSGAWIQRVLEDHEQAEITGIDIHIGQRDSEEDLPAAVAAEEFDRVRRDLNVSFCIAEGISIQRWPRMVSEMKELLQPGGYLQMIEPHYLFQSEVGNVRGYPMLDSWWNRYKRSLQARGRYHDLGPRLEGLLRTGGFVNIETEVITARIGDWHETLPLGDRIQENLLEMITSWSLHPFAVAFGASGQRAVAELVDRIRGEMSNHSLKLYYRIYVAYGRKLERTSYEFNTQEGNRAYDQRKLYVFQITELQEASLTTTRNSMDACRDSTDATMAPCRAPAWWMVEVLQFGAGLGTSILGYFESSAGSSNGLDVLPAERFRHNVKQFE